jgi:hypothetical protein
MRSFGAGFQAVQGRQDLQRKEQQQQAQQSFENQQKAAMTSAQTSMLTHQVASMALDDRIKGTKASVEDSDRMNKFMEMVSAGGEGTRYLNHFGSFAEVMKAFKDDPTLHDSHAQGQIVAIPHVEADGTINGVDAAYVTKDWQNSKTDKAYTFTVPRLVDGKMQDTSFTIEKGQTTNDAIMKLMQGQSADDLKKKQVDIEQQKANTEATRAKAEDAQAYADAKKLGIEGDLTKAELDYFKEHGELPGKENTKADAKEQEQKDWGPDGYKGYKSWHKEMVEPNLAIEKTYQLADRAYQQFKAAQAKGQRLPTGAPAMMELASHIGTTFGGQKGSRQTQALIEGHVHARGAMDNLQVMFNKLSNGDPLSDQQWDAFHDLITQARNETWRDTLDDAKALQKPFDKIPIPDDVAQSYQAREAAKNPPAAAPQAGGGGAAPPQQGGVRVLPQGFLGQTPPKPNPNAQPPNPNATHQVLNKRDGQYHWLSADSRTDYGVVR